MMGRTKIKIISMVVFLLISGTITKAQEQAGWSAPYRLSSIEGNASEGFMVGDKYGYVHVFWIETDLPDGRSVIKYARFDNGIWSDPFDIYATQPNGIPIGFLSPAIDNQGILHIAFAGANNGPVYYIHAPAYNALSAHNWTNPIRIDVPADWVRLQVDSKGFLHIVYSVTNNEQAGIYYVRSEDQGQTWSDPYKIDPDIPFDQIPSWLQFDLDDSDGLHVVWNYLKLDELGKAVKYSHSLDGGKSWSLPFTIDEPDESSDKLRMAHPGLIVQGQTVHMIWGSGKRDDNNIYREYRYSTDAGQTWSSTMQMFGKLNGQAAGGGFAIDSAGRLHYAAQVRYPKAIWEAYWDGNVWTNPSMVYLIARYDKDPEEVNRIHAHNVRLAIAHGNHLVLTFTNSPGEREPLVLYAMHRTLDDVSPSTLMPTPSPAPTLTPTPQPASNIKSILNPTPTPRHLQFTAETPLPQDGVYSTASAFWMAVIPTIILIGSVITFHLFVKKQ